MTYQINVFITSYSNSFCIGQSFTGSVLWSEVATIDLTASTVQEFIFDVDLTISSAGIYGLAITPSTNSFQLGHDGGSNPGSDYVGLFDMGVSNGVLGGGVPAFIVNMHLFFFSLTIQNIPLKIK